MSETQQHTPGPWIVDYTDSDIIAIRPDGTGYLLASIDTKYGLYRRNDYKAVANAHLIAAAPDLLEALEECAATLTHLNENHREGLANLIDVIVADAREAISKARGGHP